MQTFAQKQNVSRQNQSAKSSIPGRIHSGQNLAVSSILHPRRTLGTQAEPRYREPGTLQAKHVQANGGEARLASTPVDGASRVHGTPLPTLHRSPVQIARQEAGSIEPLQAKDNDKKSWCTPGTAKKQLPTGNLIGEIFFSRRSASLDGSDKQAIDKLARILATHPKGTEATKLLLLGDTGPVEAPKPNIGLARKRAQAVEQYLRSKLPKDSDKRVKVEVAGKGAPFPKPPPGTVRRPIVEIINRGKTINPAPAPLKKAKTEKEAFDMAVAAWSTFGPTRMEQSYRVGHWILGPGKLGVERGDDAYLRSMSLTVQKQATVGAKKLSAGDWKKLLDENRILPQLMEVAAYGNMHSDVMERLLIIDGGILGGIDFLFEKVSRLGAGGHSEGLGQMTEYILKRSKDHTSPYWIYFQSIKK